MAISYELPELPWRLRLPVLPCSQWVHTYLVPENPLSYSIWHHHWWLYLYSPLDGWIAYDHCPWPSHMQALTRIILGPQLALTLADSDLWSKANTWPEDIFLLLSPLSCGWHLLHPPWCHAFPWPYLGRTLVEDPDTYLGATSPALLSMCWLRPPPFDVQWSDCCVWELHMTNYRLWIIDCIWQLMTSFTMTVILNWIHLTLWPWRSLSFSTCIWPHIPDHFPVFIPWIWLVRVLWWHQRSYSFWHVWPTW